MGTVAEHTREIDGVTYATSTFPATMALDLLQELVGFIPENAVALLLELDLDDMFQRPEGDGEGDGEAAELGADGEELEAKGLLKNPLYLMDLARSIASQADAGAVAQFTKRLLANTTGHPLRIGKGKAKGAGNVATHFDAHFRGHLAHLLEVSVWVLQVGFGGP